MALSPEAQARVARALGAYIRATPARELPGDLKRWRSLRPQAVAARGHEIVGALEEEALRGLVVEWLDDKPPLAKKEAEIRRLAAERSDGWEAQIEKRVPKAASKKNDGTELEDLRKQVEREREKATRARAETRKTKEESRATVQAEHKRGDELERALNETRLQLEDLRTEVKSLQAEAAKERDARDREVRRERRDADRARNDRDVLKEQLRSSRKEASELRRKIRDLERRLANAAKATEGSGRAGNTKPVAPKKLRPLSAPHGLFEDSPESLTVWLQTPNVQVLIDGYNVTMGEEGFGDLHLPDQRERLVQEVARLGRKYGVVPTIIFDGSDLQVGNQRKTRLPVKVEYSSPDEIADDHLVARLSDLPPDPVIVVTNDRELQERARSKGATIATSDQLLALVR